jgi:hypothetical protein
MGFLEHADRVLIERGAPDAHVRRRPKPVENPRFRPPVAADRMDDVGALVAALVAAEPEKRQGYFLF